MTIKMDLGCKKRSRGVRRPRPKKKKVSNLDAKDATDILSTQISKSKKGILTKSNRGVVPDKKTGWKKKKIKSTGMNSNGKSTNDHDDEIDGLEKDFNEDAGLEDMDVEDVTNEDKMDVENEFHGKVLKAKSKKQKRLVKEGANTNSWVMREISGIDLVSQKIVVTDDGKYILVNSLDKVLIYSIASGQLVRQLDTGKVLAIQKGSNEGEVMIATKKNIAIWNFMEVKIVIKYPLDFNRKFKDKTIVEIIIPERFGETKEIFFCVQSPGMKKLPLYRMDVEQRTSVRIFENVKAGSVDIGQQDNLVCAISDHKNYGYENITLLMYDRNLSKVMTAHTDKARPFTCAKVHPVSKVIACGDSSGRVLVYSGLEQPQPNKSILHWHSLPVGGLCWSEEGGVLYSGGGEAVLVKWTQDAGDKPNFVPRVGGAIVGLGGGGGVTVLQLDSNRMVVVDRMSDTVKGLVGGLARNKNGWPGGVCRDKDNLLMNGGVGMVQVYNTVTGQVHSVDITQQTQLTKERNVVPHNSEVERIAVSSCGQFLATVDCMWATINRTTLKLWSWSQASNTYILNTQVDTPHQAGVISLLFQPTLKSVFPLLLSIGGDMKAKMWELTKSWSCISCMSFRELPAGAGGWSSDGTVVGLAFTHIVTLWDAQSRLRNTLVMEGIKEDIISLVFGTNFSVRNLFTATASMLVMWDLLLLQPQWTFSLSPSPHTMLYPCPTSSLLAIVQKNSVILVSPDARSVVNSFPDTNCTGGAAWIPNKVSGSSLYFLTYSGCLTKIGPNTRQTKRTPILSSTSMLQTLLSAGGTSNKEDPKVTMYTKAKNMPDIDALLSLPLHTVPPPSQLTQTMVKNRLIALPKLKLEGVEEKVEVIDEATLKLQNKIEDIFKFEESERESLDLKSFCKLLKKTSI